jgi:CHAD domain-containing protein
MSRDPVDLVAARADALLAHVRGALEGVPRDVHQARVAARRLGEVLALVDGRAVARLRRDARAIRRALGAVRELDVTLAVFDDAADRYGWPPATVARVRRGLERLRREREDEAAADRATVNLDRLRRDIRDAGARAKSMDAGAVIARARARVHDRASRMRRARAAAGALYDVERLHEVRIAVKKTRYALEVLGEATGRPRRGALRRLKAEQAVLGDLHDLQVLLEHVRSAAARVVAQRGRVAADLARMAADLETECRRRHGEWVALEPVTIRV